MTGLMTVRGLLGVLVVLVLSLAFAVGCSLGSGQDQALEEQKQKNEELQKQLEEQQQKEARRKKKEEEARQKELEKQVKDLQEKVEEQEKEQASDSSGVSSESGIQNSSTDPSQADEGIVVVSPGFDTNAATAEEAEVINAAIEYYQYAEIGDYYSTYSLLSYEDQNYYTQDQWIEANTALDSAAGEFVVTDAYPDDLGLGVPTYAVTLTVYVADGSSFDRTTYFINEGGYWAHYLSGEEVDMFDDALY